jgi:carbonic anhydrase
MEGTFFRAGNRPEERRRFGRVIVRLCALLSIGICLSSGEAASGQNGGASPAPSSVVTVLTEGNRRFVAGTSHHPHEGAQRRQDTVKYGQHPKAVVLSCADSRVSPELLFDQGIGDLFTIRVAGNVANEDEIASVEYATEHLHTPLVVVLGHTGCGAVTAVANGESLPGPAFAHLATHIREAVATVRKANPKRHGDALIAAAVEANVREAITDLVKGSPTLQHQVKERRVRIVGAIYDLRTGQVHWLQPASH